MPIPQPILLDLPVPIKTARLTIRPIMPGDGKTVHAAIEESFSLLSEWLPWAHALPTVEQVEENARRFYADFILRTAFHFVLLDGEQIIGMSSLHGPQWAIPSLDLGYWCRRSAQGQGYITEAGAALTCYAFDHIGVKRLSIRCDGENIRSRAVAERLGFVLETAAPGITWKPGDPNLRVGQRYVRFDTRGLEEFNARSA